jgi:hypothetical protein
MVRFPTSLLTIHAYSHQDDILIKACTIGAFQRPSDRLYTSIRGYHYNTKPLLDKETESIQHKYDIVTLRSGRELASFDSWVEAGIESTLSRFDFALQVIPLPN